jgi:phosphatidylserine decarboxylase
MRLCSEGHPFIGGTFAATVLFWILASAFHSPIAGFIAGLAFLGTLFCLWFFRDPARSIAQGDRLILSPAYGKVMQIAEAVDPATHEKTWVIHIFLSVFDPHMQLAPVAGRVTKVTYTEGKFLDARDPKASFENEQNRMEIQPSSPALKSPVIVTQIAGLIARRILCDVRENQTVRPGEKIGLIRFGSQVDMILPPNLVWRVKVGDKVEGGMILAEVSA